MYKCGNIKCDFYVKDVGNKCSLGMNVTLCQAARRKTLVPSEFQRVGLMDRDKKGNNIKKDRRKSKQDIKKYKGDDDG
jgi:hypothetical protein